MQENNANFRTCKDEGMGCVLSMAPKSRAMDHREPSTLWPLAFTRKSEAEVTQYSAAMRVAATRVYL